jgi:hypothetical protein
MFLLIYLLLLGFRLHQNSIGQIATFLAFTGEERSQVPLCALFQA